MKKKNRIEQSQMNDDSWFDDNHDVNIGMSSRDKKGPLRLNHPVDYDRGELRDRYLEMRARMR